MTDEEYKLAEEIILPIFRKVIRNDDSLAKYGINCYYAGLKAGRPEWHKVADGDLPKDNRLVLIQVVNGNTTMGIYYVNAWREICYCKELTGVIAWCEIPKYTKE